MPRQARNTPGGFVYHALNRGTARLKLLRKPADYEAFLGVLGEALQGQPTRLLAYCLMPTHWHFVLWPQGEHDLSAFCRWAEKGLQPGLAIFSTANVCKGDLELQRSVDCGRRLSPECEACHC